MAIATITALMIVLVRIRKNILRLPSCPEGSMTPEALTSEDNAEGLRESPNTDSTVECIGFVVSANFENGLIAMSQTANLFRCLLYPGVRMML